MVAVIHSRPTTGPRSSPTARASCSPPAGRAVVPELTYRRRRAAAAGIVVALVLAGQGLLSALGASPGTDRPPAPIPAEELSGYVVQPGDTFWSLVHRMAPDRDPRPLVDRMVADHGSAVLEVGERIALPERR